MLTTRQTCLHLQQDAISSSSSSSSSSPATETSISLTVDCRMLSVPFCSYGEGHYTRMCQWKKISRNTNEKISRNGQGWRLMRLYLRITEDRQWWNNALFIANRLAGWHYVNDDDFYIAESCLRETDVPRPIPYPSIIWSCSGKKICAMCNFQLYKTVCCPCGVYAHFSNLPLGLETTSRVATMADTLYGTVTHYPDSLKIIRPRISM